MLEYTNILVGFALLGLLYRYIIYPLFLSPLCNVPSAHWSAKLSPIWSLWVRYRGTELANLIKLHEIHGPVVQVGPKDLSVSEYQDGIRKVYDAGFGKPAAWYSFFDYYRYTHSTTKTL
jgi:hypothetical protein